MAKATRNPTRTIVQAEGETIVQPIGDGRQEYVVTDRAPMRVAGRRVKTGDTLRLTEDEARGELLALHIAPKAETTDASAQA